MSMSMQLQWAYLPSKKILESLVAVAVFNLQDDAYCDKW